MLSAAAALTWANSAWAESYARLWHTPVGIRLGDFSFERPLEWVVNDGLMAIFFFVVGLEIRREVAVGELSSWRRAALPAAAALGGMVAPALLYLSVAGAPATQSGWGVPMATDIAFAIGVLTLLGARVPPALRVLLLALAVIDDLGAIVVIAIAYSAGLTLWGFALAAGGVGGILVMRWLGVRAKGLYVVPGVVVWAGIYVAGIHPTIAGVIVGLMTPVRAWLGAEGFVERVRDELAPLAASMSATLDDTSLHHMRHVAKEARREAISPAESLIESLHPWVNYFIMPVFALANAGVTLSYANLDADALRAVWGVTLGLLLGKPLGVLLASWLVLRTGLALRPAGIEPRHMVVLGLVAGVGFTMALFIAQLAFAEPSLLAAAKLGILGSSLAAALLALALGSLLLSAGPHAEASKAGAETAG